MECCASYKTCNYYMATHPTMLSRNLIGWSSRRKAPSCPKDSAAKQNWNRMFDKISQILGKLRKAIKLRKMLSIKLVSGHFSENSRWVFWQFSENLRTNRKPWENYFGLISWKIFFRRIVGKLSVNVRNIFVFDYYLLTGLLVQYREKLSPRFLCTDLASSVRTSKPRA